MSFRLPRGLITGIMGPNGAGKTTLFNLVTGVHRPTGGIVRFSGIELQNLSPFRICRSGIARTFQSGRPFGNLTARENIMVGLLYGAAPMRDKHAASRKANEVLDFVGLARQAERPVSNLNLMERKIVELARALATQPKLLLLDEILAGLNPADLEPAIKIICRVRDELGITVLWIEHIMQVLMKTCEHLIVLHHGEMLTEGMPENVVVNQQVADAYFGTKGPRRGA
ncbi:ABC transporter ATP-binding protein [Pseudorhodoplanes sp.]|uniref:ABC transporter ATP-binding protein n=1 Tax=Pseudorhodoplanes sp. TaxID=1934341 RepID=UPI003D0A4A61